MHTSCHFRGLLLQIFTRDALTISMTQVVVGRYLQHMAKA